MNLSALFIKRPITTTLIMLGIMVFGLMAYSDAAGHRSASHRLPDHSSVGGASGRQPRDDGVIGRPAAREAVRDHRGPDEHQFDQRPGQHEHHAAVRPHQEHRRSGAGRPVDDGTSIAEPAAADAGPALLSEVQSSRSIDHPARPPLAHLAAVDGGRIRRADDRPAHLDGERRGAGRRVRLAEVRRPGRRRSPSARRALGRHRRGRRCNWQCERQLADRHDLRPRRRSWFKPTAS